MIALTSVDGFHQLITLRSPLHWTPILAPLKVSFQHIRDSALPSRDGNKLFQSNHTSVIIKY